MDDNVFADCYVEFVTLKVPETSVDLYKAAEQWKDFGTILPIEDTGINDLNLSKSVGHVFNVSGQKVKSGERMGRIFNATAAFCPPRKGEKRRNEK